ncbi:MAG: NADH-quinone oxidoreductase subunit H [Deltaproteobacteria bacterium]|nr:NADH-quinone oxidoreductase subunit H [Deltaproteobacteria bacterium]
MHAHAHRLLALLLLVFTGLVAPTGCADPPSSSQRAQVVRTEPSTVVFHPETKPVAVDVINTSDKPIAVGDFRVEGPDWASFSLVEPMNAGILRPGDRATLHVQVDAVSLRGPGEPVQGSVVEHDAPREPIGPNDFREGSASLSFRAAGTTAAVALRFEDPPWTSQYLWPAILKVLALVMAFIMPLASLLTWMERKQSAMMQDRVGPNMARITIGSFTLRAWGLLHIATDGLKMLFKEDFVPRRAHRALYTLAPLLAFIPALVVFAIVPFGDGLCYGRLFDSLSQADVDQCAAGRGGTPLQIAQIDVGLLYYFAIASLATYGTTLAGWSSYNKWAVLGSLRASAQMISYEVAIGLTIVGALLVYGTLEPHALVMAQTATHWGILLQPLAFILFFTAALAETKRAPFDLPEAESEIIGYFIEYSGMRFGLFFLGEFIEVVFVSALVTTLFLGGWTLPFGILGAHGFSSALACQAFFGGAGITLMVAAAMWWRASKHAEGFASLVLIIGTMHLLVAVWSLFTGWGTELPHIAVVSVGLLTWGLKVLALCWLQLLIRWTLPRFRYDQLMSLGWKGLLPLSIANIVLTAVVVYALTPSAEAPATGPNAAAVEAKAPADTKPTGDAKAPGDAEAPAAAGAPADTAKPAQPSEGKTP